MRSELNFADGMFSNCSMEMNFVTDKSLGDLRKSCERIFRMLISPGFCFSDRRDI